MRKSIFILIMTLFVTALSVQAQRLSITATKKNGNTALAGSYTVSAEGVQYVQNASSPIVATADPFFSKGIALYTVSDNIDTLYNRLNKYHPTVVKALVSSIISGTSRDTLIQWLLPIDKLAKTVSGQSSVNQQAYLQTASGYKKLYLGESVGTLNYRIDSLFDVINNAGNYVYDTSNYTLKTYDQHVILNSSTADTLTLLNPSQFATREPIVVANIGSGAYTLAGGFTVKDKSGSNVTSLTANTVYTFKSYYNGSAYIWLKEY